MMRLATYNVEWFTELFDDQGQLLNDNSQSIRYGVTKAQRIAAVGAVFQALDADGVMVIEAPDTNHRRSTVTALEQFARAFGLRARRAVTGFASDTEQEIAFLFDPDQIDARHAPQSTVMAPAFDQVVPYHIDGATESLRFSKPPLELLLTLPQPLRLIGVHTKSKAVHDTRDPAEFNRLSVQNRRKQLAECFWIRARVDDILAQNHSLLVMGDFNDGPGQDEYERKFLYSSIEVVTGQYDPTKRPLFDPNALQTARIWGGQAPKSSRFWLGEKQDFFEAMLDFIMVSENLRPSEWRIWHPCHDSKIVQNPDLARSLLTASDHFPVTIDITLPKSTAAD